MARPPKERNPEERVDAVEKERRKAMRQFKEKPHKAGSRAPGELEFKKDMSIILKVAGYSHSQIAASLGETKGTVRSWFQDKDVVERFQKISKELTESAKRLLHTYTIEAVQALVTVMRTSKDEAMIVKAACEILDRGGLPKVSRTESKREEVPSDDDKEIEKFRKLSPEEQEKVARMQAEIEEYLVTP